MTKGLFAALDIYYDDDQHSAAMNMAIDEALLDSVAIPSIRFYRWQSPALSFGYFGKFTDVADYLGERDKSCARRRDLKWAQNRGSSAATHQARFASARQHPTRHRTSPSDRRRC